MRFLVCGLVLLAAATSPAFAGDFGDLLLRGSAQPAADPPNYPRWAESYFGGQASADFQWCRLSAARAGGIDCNIMAQARCDLTNCPLTLMPQLPT